MRRFSHGQVLCIRSALFSVAFVAALAASATAQYAPQDGPYARGLTAGPSRTDAAVVPGGAIELGTSNESTLRVSVDSGGREGDGHGFVPALSQDGRFVAFASTATDVVPDDTNGASDIFVHDRQTGVTTRVSVSSAGAQNNGDSVGPSISGDGRLVAFRSLGSLLVAGDTNGTFDIFLHDRQTGITTRVSVDSSGFESNGTSSYAALSADGRFVAFESDATNLIASDFNFAYDVFVHEIATGLTTIASLDDNGAMTSISPSFEPSISADGRFVAFSTYANFVGDFNVVPDVYMRDRLLSKTERISVGTSGEPNDQSRQPCVSADGRYVAFDSAAANLVAGDTNAVPDIFVRDRQTQTTTRASVRTGGSQGNGASDVTYSTRMLSSDGRFVLFESVATNLGSVADTNGVSDVFLHDRQSATTTRVSVDSTGHQGNGLSYRAALSGDGQLLGFESEARNLIAGDVNLFHDVFVHLSTPGCPPITSYCTAKTNSQGCIPAISSSGIPSVAGTDGFYLSASRVLEQQNGMFVWSLAPAATPFGGGTLCLQAPIVRTAIHDTGSDLAPPHCSGAHSFHFGQAYMASRGLSVGTAVYGQFLSRDPRAAPPFNLGLTDAISFAVCP